MFETWGRLVHRRRKPILWLSLAAVLLCAAWGAGVMKSLTSAGAFDTPGTSSYEAASELDASFGRTEPDVVVLYGGPVDRVETEAAVAFSLERLPKDDVASVATYWTTGSDRFVSADRKSSYAVVTLSGRTAQDRARQYTEVEPLLRDAGALTVRLGGQLAVEDTINTRVAKDIGKADAISLPILLVLLLAIFGGLVAASLPLAIGGIAILGSFGVLNTLARFMEVSSFAVSISTFLGLGLAIDYGLFMVWRFREELARSGGDVGRAVERTMATAGRTVVFSGVTVAVSMSGLLIFPQLFLRSMGLGGVGTVLIAMAAAVVVLPALLSVLGPRVDSRKARRGDATAASAGQRWRLLADAVMRRPLLVGGAVVALLLVLGLPFLRISWGGIDTSVLPVGTEARAVAETLQHDFAAAGTVGPIEVALTGASAEQATAYLATLERVPGVTGGEITGVAGDLTRLQLSYASAQPYSAEARAIVDRVRETPAPGRAEVGGISATLHDQLASVGERLPLLAAIVGVATFLLLFLAFGSVVLPLKAIAMNLVSLAATFGALVWIFQDGRFSGVLDFTPTGDIAPAMPILMLALLFGLSMDYEVFLLSRVREQYLRTGDNTVAVATGLQRTGSIITGAALLFVVVVVAFATSGISFMKMTGIGMAIAITVDATIVRALLVPATMRLLGAANWWAPRPLRRLHEHLMPRHAEADPVPGPRPAPAVPDTPREAMPV